MSEIPEKPVYAFFSADMAETLMTYFRHYEKDGVVALELNRLGIWLVNPHDRTRQFLGKAVHDDDTPVILPPRAKWM
jgi:hypothetical protein